MSDEGESEDDQVHTTVEVDRSLWRKVRAKAVREDENISPTLETILREYFQR
jgi:hypothetical protein